MNQIEKGRRGGGGFAKASRLLRPPASEEGVEDPQACAYRAATRGTPRNGRYHRQGKRQLMTRCDGKQQLVNIIRMIESGRMIEFATSIRQEPEVIVCL